MDYPFTGVTEVGGADLHEGALSEADLFQQLPLLLRDQDAVVLLVLCTPDLQDAERLIPDLYLGHMQAGVNGLMHRSTIGAMLKPFQE